MRYLKELQSLSCDVRLREDGIVETQPRPDWCGVEGLKHARSTMEAVKEISGDRRRPVLSFMSNHGVNREARQYYSSATVGAASAIIAKSPFQRVIANFLLGLNKLQVPMRVFSDEAAAVQWLRQFLGVSQS